VSTAPIRFCKEVSALPATLAANTLYLVRVGTGFDLYATDSTGAIAYTQNSYKYTREWHVDPVGGKDTNPGSFAAPFKTLGQAVSVAGNTGEQIVLHPGTYAESVTLTQLNLTVTGAQATIGGEIFVSGTITVNQATANSIRINGLMIGTLAHNGAGGLYCNECQINAITKTSTNYSEFNQCNVSSVSLTSAAQAAFNGGKQVGLTINNSSAIVTVHNSVNCAVVVVTAGILNVRGGFVFGATTTSNVITAAAGTQVYLTNCGIYNSVGADGRISLAGFYTLEGVDFDRANSALTGTNIGRIHWGDKLGVLNADTITTATKMLVRKTTGEVAEQLIPSGGTAAETFDTLDKNLKSYDYALAFSGGKLSTKTWTTTGGDIVLTYTWSGDVLQSKTFSGAGVPAAVTKKTKTYTWTGTTLTNVAYS
jgi:hypothetical protein